MRIQFCNLLSDDTVIKKKSVKLIGGYSLLSGKRILKDKKIRIG